MYIAGLDIGTTTISGVLADFGEMRLLHAKTVSNDAACPKGERWEHTQDPERIYEKCLKLLRHFSSLCPGIGAIGLTGQMHGMVYTGGDGMAAGKLITWQDERGNLEYREGLTYWEYLQSRTGYPMSTGFGLCTHFYNTLNGLVPENAVSACTIADYVAMRLCGRKKAVTHVSNAAGFGLFDVQKGGFDEAAAEKAGINPSILPAVLNGEKIIGRTEEGIPVCIPIGDNQASFLGSVNKESNTLVNIGTGSQISVLCGSVLKNTALEYRPYIGGNGLLVGSGLCGGSAYAHLKDFFSEVLALFGEPYKGDLYAKMEEAAKKVYGAENALVIDTRFRGDRRQPGLRGSIQNIGADNFTPGHLAEGVLRGICRELKSYYREMPDACKNPGFIVGSGNAIRKNAALRRILSDVFEKELKVPLYEEEASLGAAMLAAHAAMNRPLDTLQGLIQYGGGFD